MKKTEQTLLEQMRITDFEIDNRKALFGLTDEDATVIKGVRPFIEHHLNGLVERFYELQTAIPEIGLLIGDAETLSRLHAAQRRYILDLFSGYYDLEYVNNRLRIGLVHKRIGVEPKLYLAGIQTLMEMLISLIKNASPDYSEGARIVAALQRLVLFDVSLVFDTYIRSLIAEIEISKEKSEQYAHSLEEKVKERTHQLENLSKTDPLTGLLNVRHLSETLTRALRAAQRRDESLTVAYIDLNDFKIVNDTQGHHRGDELLMLVAKALRGASRMEDYCFRCGGDEFCVIMSNCTIEHARDVWENRVYELIIEQEPDLSLSIGYAQTDASHVTTADELIRQADERMYTVKKKRKSQQQTLSSSSAQVVMLPR